MQTRIIRKPRRQLGKNSPMEDILFFVGVLATLSVFLIIDKCQQRRNAKEERIDCYTELNREVAGTVARAFEDENINHKGYVIEFTNGKSYRPRYVKNWGKIDLDPGDSVYKKSGIFRIFIFKNGQAPLIINDTIDCEKIEAYLESR
jgi:hypothetical protein